MEQSPWKLRSSQLVKIFPAFYGTQRFITTFTRARHMPLFWARSIQSLPIHSNSRRSSHLRLGLPSDLFPSGFPNKALYAPPISPIRALCSFHLILLRLITRLIFGEEYRSLSSSLCSFLHILVNWPFLGPNILLSTWLLHHDHATAHAALLTRRFLTDNSMAVVPHPPDLAPSDFFLFPKLKMKLKRRRFQTEEIQAETQAVLNTLRENDFQECFKHL